MNNNKAIIGAASVALICMIALSQSGAAPGVSLFMSSSAAMDAFRAVLLTLLASLLVVKVPRPLLLRGILGVSSIALTAASIYMLGNYQMQLLDGLLFITIASVLGFEALEFDPQVTGLREALET